jgi:hypothetical protein
MSDVLFGRTDQGQFFYDAGHVEQEDQLLGAEMEDK